MQPDEDYVLDVDELPTVVRARLDALEGILAEVADELEGRGSDDLADWLRGALSWEPVCAGHDGHRPARLYRPRLSPDPPLPLTDERGARGISYGAASAARRPITATVSRMSNEGGAPAIGMALDDWLAARRATDQHLAPAGRPLTKDWIRDLSHLLNTEHVRQDAYTELLVGSVSGGFSETRR